MSKVPSKSVAREFRRARLDEFFALGVVMRKWPSAKSSMDLNSGAPLPLPHVFTSIFTASFAYFSSSKLPNVNFDEGLAFSGTPIYCCSLSSLLQAIKANEAIAIIKE